MPTFRIGRARRIARGWRCRSLPPFVRPWRISGVVVTAIGEIAATLARLAGKSVGHRDIKPGNLYCLDGRWLVGGFGLVAAPDLDELTREGKAVGPAHFTAYEMIRDPVNADPLPADVFSLAKTLWALATGQEWPPLGHQPATTRGYLLGDLRPHAHADALDRLIDGSTRAKPEERPTMAEIAADLQAWHELGQTADQLDVAELGARLRAKMEHELAADDRLEQPESWRPVMLGGCRNSSGR